MFVKYIMMELGEFSANIGVALSIKDILQFGKSYYINCELEPGITLGCPVITLMSEE